MYGSHEEQRTSDSSEDHYGAHERRQRLVIQNGRKLWTTRNRKGDVVTYDITHLVPYSQRFNRGRGVKGNDPPIRKNNQTDKWVLYQIVLTMHRWFRKHPKRSVYQFKRRFQRGANKMNKAVRAASLRSLQRWREQYGPNSRAFAELQLYNKRTKKERAKKVFRFFKDPFTPRCGLCKILETFLVEYRSIAAQQCHLRSVNWMVSQMRRVVKCEQLLRLLRPLMDEFEKAAVPNLDVTRKYVRDIIVCLPFIPFNHSIRRANCYCV